MFRTAITSSHFFFGAPSSSTRARRTTPHRDDTNLSDGTSSFPHDSAAHLADAGRWQPQYTKCVNGSEFHICEATCKDKYGLGPFPSPVYDYTRACDQLTGTSCTNYDPDAAIALVGGVYEVDHQFVKDLATDPSPLYACDDALANEVSGLFELSSVSAGEFLYEVGLRNGDRIVSINGMNLDNYYDAIFAYTTLFRCFSAEKPSTPS